MLKTSLQLADALPATSVNNSEIICSSSRKDKKSAKSNFKKPVRRARKPSFSTPNTRQTFTQLRHTFTKLLIF